MYKITVLDSGSTNSALIEGATNSSPLNKWTYVCFTYTANVANGLHLYVNGVEDANSPVSTIGITAIDAGTNPLRIGALSAVTNLFVGQIDDVRVFTRMLSASEVLQLYNSGK